ncbi:hypothetical protein ACZ90_54115 [Streptomyces albus subsp. albus]|nr:hypothetical protein ACZ90_54115 [Streptomyces albus subsp. albus]
MLCTLALHLGRTVSVDRLIDAAWSADAPVTARAQIQAHVSTLRQVLGTAAEGRVLQTRESGYALAAEEFSSDLDAFSRSVAQAHADAAAGRDAAAARTLRAGLGLWRGHAFDALPSRTLEAEAARLEELRLGAWEECVALEITSRGPGSDVIAELSGMIAAHPLRESAHRLLLMALHGAGRPAEALAAYDRARRLLAEELGTEPGPALRAVYQQVLTNQAPPTTAVQGPAALAGTAAQLVPSRGAADDTIGSRPAGQGRVAVRTPLFGRDGDVAAITARLVGRRLVTLVGPRRARRRTAARVRRHRRDRPAGGVAVPRRRRAAARR